MTTVLPLSALTTRALALDRVVEHLLPVGPQRRGVGLEVGHRDAGAGQRLLGGPGRVDRRERGVLEHLGRDAEAADRLVQREVHRRQPQRGADQVGRAQGAGEQGGGQPVGDAAVDGDGELRGLRGGGEGVDQLDGVLRLGVDQVEGLAVEVGLVRDVVHRLGDVVDRHDVGVAEVDADQRQPAREVVAHPLEQREEVVGAVDLVHRAGLGVADDDRRAVDPPRHLGLLADDLLGLELGAVVRRGQPLALVEHRLVEDPAEVAGRGDRGHLVEVTGLELAGERRRRCGCRRRSSSRSSRRWRSCRRSRRGGRSGRSRRGAPRSTRGRRRGRAHRGRRRPA